MYNVQCSFFIVPCRVQCIQGIVYSVSLRPSVQCTVQFVQCVVYTKIYLECSFQYSVSIVQCAIQFVQYAINHLHLLSTHSRVYFILCQVYTVKLRVSARCHPEHVPSCFLPHIPAVWQCTVQQYGIQSALFTDIQYALNNMLQSDISLFGSLSNAAIV